MQKVISDILGSEFRGIWSTFNRPSIALIAMAKPSKNAKLNRNKYMKRRVTPVTACSAWTMTTMEIDADKPVPHAYTLLRIKRKRNEEPLDALGRPSVQPISFSDCQMVLIHPSR